MMAIHWSIARDGDLGAGLLDDTVKQSGAIFFSKANRFRAAGNAPVGGEMR